ncbi:hypothetical protein KCP74_24090 [Salmonella enterica subsp. enterica]|nr:hypothetical protein KCP74_24090 [Salmonella enterica subsp. enterica]
MKAERTNAPISLRPKGNVRRKSWESRGGKTVADSESRRRTSVRFPGGSARTFRRSGKPARWYLKPSPPGTFRR